MNENVLEVKNAVKYYTAGKNVIKAVDNVSFSAGKGEFIAVMGASGSGKSTLLSILSTIENISSGDIFIEGKNIAEMKENDKSDFRRDKLGFIFQSYNLLETLTVSENLALPLNLQKKSAAETEEKVQVSADKLGISDILDKFPNELSGGECQRAACARALITSPALIMADEPTGALDSANSIKLMDTLSHLNKEEKVTILLVTHDALVGSYADRVMFLKDGKIWNEIYKGDRQRKDFYNAIVNVISSTGGDNDVN